MVEIFANSGDPDKTPRSAASDLYLHCLPVIRLVVSSLQWVSYVGSKFFLYRGDPFTNGTENYLDRVVSLKCISSKGHNFFDFLDA